MKHFLQISVILFIFFFVSCDAYKEEKEYAQMLILKIEKYKSENGELPETVKDIGLEFNMDDPAFYVKTSDTSYIVYYVIAGVGNSNVYYSETKQWKEEG